MRFVAVALLVLAAIAGLGVAPAADTGWVIERFQSDITVEADGALRVGEAIDVDFQGLTDRHGIYREIPVEYRNDAQTVRVFELSVDGVTDAQGRRLTYATASHGANLQVKIGDASRTVAGKQTYRIAYRVRGALDAYPDHDELYWNVNGAEWPVPTRATVASVTFAAGGLERAACFEGPTGATGSCRLGPRTATRAAYGDARLGPASSLRSWPASQGRAPRAEAILPREGARTRGLVRADRARAPPRSSCSPGLALVGWNCQAPRPAPARGVTRSSPSTSRHGLRLRDRRPRRRAG